MEWVETTGKSVEEAKEAALDQLGVDESDAEFQILEEPRAGLFGRMRSEARVRARVRPSTPRPKVERRGRSRRGARTNDEAAGDAETAETVTAETVTAETVTAEPGPRRRSRAKSTGGDTGKTRAAGAGTAEDTDSDDGAQAPDNTRVNTREDKETPVGETLTLEEQADLARDFLLGVADRFGVDADATIRSIDEDTIEVALTGSDLGLLVGPKGATLQALQDLARTVVQRHTTTRTGRLLVDVAGYRQKRKEALEKFATSVAADVVASGRQKVLEPMNPADRKVVHDTINLIDGVSTTSEGEEPRRRVVIMPAGAE